MDELLALDPEPCDTCRTGLMLFICYDNIRRCRRCVQTYVDERGWNNRVLPQQPKRKKKGPDPNQGTIV